MGVGIVVNGLVNVSKGANTSIAKAGWNFVKDICDAMGWKEIPWQEPKGEGGLGTSRSYGTYNLLLEVALAADPNNPIFKRDGGVICECKSTIFPQLLDRDLYWNIYVPFDLPEPIVFGECGYSFSIGSVVRYGQELDKLAPYINEEYIKQVFQTDEMETKKILDRISDIFKMLRIGVADSLRLNLPLQIRW